MEAKIQVTRNWWAQIVSMPGAVLASKDDVRLAVLLGSFVGTECQSYVFLRGSIERVRSVPVSVKQTPGVWDRSVTHSVCSSGKPLKCGTGRSPTASVGDQQQEPLTRVHEQEKDEYLNHGNSIDYTYGGSFPTGDPSFLRHHPSPVISSERRYLLD